MRKLLTFIIPKENILNSNSYKNLHWAIKGKKTEYLRNLAINEGLKHHDANNIEAVNNQLDYLKDLSNQATAKSRRTKALQKSGLSAKEIKEKVAEEFAEEEIKRVGDAPETLFNQFSILVTVCPPTRRRIDPVNLYPTVKAIIDGLTDSAWWEDDDSKHLLQISFRYGGLSGEKDKFKLIMDVSEVEDSSEYILHSEVAN